MSDEAKAALDMIERQVKELDGILTKTTQDLNTVAGKERLAKWKALTAPLIAQHLGPKQTQRFSETQPGPSFTNDLLEEFGDEVDVYRSCLIEFKKELQKQAK